MATLTDAAYIARKGVNIAIILIVAGVVLRLILGIVLDVLNPLINPPAPPNNRFGQLPMPNFNSGPASPSGTVTFILDPAFGSLPTLPKTIRVYAMPSASASFDAYNQMAAQAAKLGFTDNPKKIGDTLFEFTDRANALRTLDIDQVSGNFNLKYNYASDLSLFNDRNFPSQEALADQARNFFSGLGLLTDDLKGGRAKVVFLKLDNNKLTPTTSLSNADAVLVTLGRSDIDKIPVVSPDANHGLISVLFSGSRDRNKAVVEVGYYYNAVDKTNFATYAPEDATKAFGSLKTGKAIFASWPAAGSTAGKITVTKVTLGYLDPFPHQGYLQPVWIFEDEKGFSAYVPAVTPQWLK